MIKKLFIAAAIVGLIVNLASDLVVFNQNKVAVSTGEWVGHSYKTSQFIDAIRIGILESQINNSVGPRLHQQIKNLAITVQDIPSQSERALELSSLSDQELLTKKFNPALKIISEMSAAEAALLSVRTLDDERSNSAAISHALFANAVDVILIFLFLGFYFYERRASLKIQNKMAKNLLGVEASRQKLKFLMAQKKAQYKSAVHDLKNPLGSIRGFAELIHEEAENKDSILEMADIIQEVSNNSLNLVGTLLSEDEPDKSSTQALNVINCLKETCLYLRPIADEKNQRIKFGNLGHDFTIAGQKHEVQDIFYNLIGNALKFSPQGSLVFIEGSEENGQREIKIKDSGPGFATEDFSKLFQQGAKLTAKPTGSEVSTGLGLYSAKQSIERFGGSIRIENDASGGACVTVGFPISTATRSLDN